VDFLRSQLADLSASASLGGLALDALEAAGGAAAAGARPGAARGGRDGPAHGSLAFGSLSLTASGLAALQAGAALAPRGAPTAELHGPHGPARATPAGEPGAAAACEGLHSSVVLLARRTSREGRSGEADPPQGGPPGSRSTSAGSACGAARPSPEDWLVRLESPLAGGKVRGAGWLSSNGCTQQAAGPHSPGADGACTAQQGPHNTCERATNDGGPLCHCAATVLVRRAPCSRVSRAGRTCRGWRARRALGRRGPAAGAARG
jgi:hypothetical protein